MRAFSYRLYSRQSLGASLALLAGVLFAPARAHAGCGDHVVVTTRSEEAAAFPSPLPARPANQHAPCSGPHCTQSPLIPVPTPLVPVVSSVQQWACILEPPLLSVNNSSPYLGEAPSEPPLFAVSTIYHPPR